MSEIQIRAAARGDEEALSAVGKASFLEAFAGTLDGSDIIAHCEKQHAAAVYRDWLADADMRIWLAEVSPGRAPVGYLVLAPARLPIAEPRAARRVCREPRCAGVLPALRLQANR